MAGGVWRKRYTKPRPPGATPYQRGGRAHEEGQSLRSMARRAGLVQPQLTHFLAGRDILLTAADKLIEFFDLEVRRRPAARRRAQR